MRPAGDRIEVRFTWQGKEIRPTLPLKPTAANMRHAARQRADILEEIAAGTFQLERHFPGYKFAAKHAPANEHQGRTLADWADVWAKLARRELEHSTITIYTNHLNTYWLAAFGHMKPSRVTHEMLLGRLADLAEPRLDTATGKIRKGLARKTQNNILIPLRGVFALACKDGSFPNPTDGINCLKVQTGNPDPFTADEVEAILADLRKPRGRTTAAQAQALADYFEFAFFAGLRPSEQIALLWSDVDLRAHTVTVQRARVLKQEKDRTKTHRARHVELNARAWAALERQRARTQLLAGKVFLNPFTGKAWNNGEEQRREWMDCLRRVGVRHRPPKECRDTSVTLALMAGADPYWVAAQHGHSVQTMMKDYAKYIPQADRGRNLAAVNASLTPVARKAIPR
ncbi:site-specific integrase [Aquincola tertiaricarbonis]|uniref:Site-specific integrase n=1 Tax=Aquincola tertiaricarbonis TaxID=391953 RepID=A0ABY4SGX0_AQUTE|nr:site-specific integrase [Aquincola tertiaricarbonis]URI11028.1 site-specific integrase [Aquincola tertiaricarbonis]